ncbi:hypothetical protein DL769_001777 [Monosporascus sp. CRB-8-3]|nr:hypothetical protein DL769_001777 [Monosporascus sp. CRB-8-3]
MKNFIFALSVSLAACLPSGDLLEEFPTISLTNVTMAEFDAPIEARWDGPHMDISFPDPSIIQDKKDGKWKGYATSSNNKRIPIAESADSVNWKFLNKDALPDLPSWIDNNDRGLWAPDVFRDDKGHYVMYFAGKQAGGRRCIGVATAATWEGPFKDIGRPLICDQAGGGAIDANAFDDGSQRWIMWKVDGNALGGATTCTGGEKSSDYKPTPIKIQRVARDGITLQGSPKTILNHNGAADDGLVEGPAMYKIHPDQYVLFFSTHCYSSDRYDIQYAFSRTPDGPYTRAGILAQSGGNPPIYGPGHMDIDKGEYVAFHGRTAPGNPQGSKRYMFTGRIDFV